MVGMMHTPKLLFLIVLALAVSGCSRSSDGSVVIPEQMDMRRIWDREPPVQRVLLGQNPAVFPVSPQASQPRRVVAVAPRTRRAPIRTTQTRNEPVTSSPLNCRNVSEPGKRARMVCD